MSTPTGSGRKRRPSLIRQLMDRVAFVPEHAEEAPMLSRMRRGNLPPLAPEVGSAVDAVRSQMSRLITKGAVDEGNGGVMDVTIDAWVEQWHNDIDNEHDARQSELQLIQAEASAELERRKTMLSVVRADFEAVSAEIESLTAVADWSGPRKPRGLRQRLLGLFRRRTGSHAPDDSGGQAAPSGEPGEQAAPHEPAPEEQQHPGHRREPKATEVAAPTAEDR